MCGIAGYVLRDTKAELLTSLCSALDKLRHRGPDDAGLVVFNRNGQWKDFALEDTDRRVAGTVPLEASRVPDHHIALGHRRFSIIDTSVAGHQPFWSEDKAICVAFNGEIYNYVELRQELEAEGLTFRTRSDTEVLVQAYRVWGTDCLCRFVGFWAVTLYDTRKKQLLLARDRIGKAPLYIFSSEYGLFWSSEIKGLLEMAPVESSRIDEQSVFDFANWRRRDFHDRTFYRSIKTFPRASFAWVDDIGRFEPRQYWSIPTTRLRETDISIHEASLRFNSIIDDAVRIRLRADVPVGSQLSGGMDSSTLLASACRIRNRLDTYTVKFRDKGADEEPYARAVAERYRDQVDYHVIEPPSADLLDDLDAYLTLMDEPFHSPNQYTNFRVWRTMSKEGLRVVLYGAGGDEVFAGYGSDYFAPYLRLLAGQGRFLRLAKEFFSFSEYTRQRHLQNYAFMVRMMSPSVPKRADRGQIGFVPDAINPLRVSSLAHVFEVPPADFNERLIANMQDWRMNYWLRVDNQNSMGVPVELRSPFLDHRLVEFAFQLPESYLIRNGWLKWIVRYAMRDRLPNEIVWRCQKMGFPFPLKVWLSKHQEFFQERLLGVDCPYIDTRTLFGNYGILVSKYSNFMWSLLSLLLWWKSSQ